MFRFNTCIFILAIIFPLIIADDPCSFTTSDGVIDISSVGHSDGSAAFPDKTPSGASNWKFSYNPCRPFTENQCQNVAACQVSADGLFQYAVGTQDTAKWAQGGAGSNIVITYTAGPKITQVELICNPGVDGDVEAIGEGPIETYKFRFTSKCACPNGCKAGPQPTTARPSGDGSGALTGGTYFIIILASVVVIYVIVFVVYSKVRLHNSGLDLIPHRTFWVGLPGHAKDGVLFLVRKITRRDGAYNSV